MKINDAIKTLDRVDVMGIWALTMPNLRIILQEPLKTFNKTIARLESAGIILRVSKGFYVNPRAKCLPADTLTSLVSFLRPWSFNYLSLESALSEFGVISQIPSRLTIMTTGRKGLFYTPYGVIEFVHTSRNANEIAEGVYFDAGRSIYVATPKHAERDLRRVGRNIGLINHENMDDD